MIVAPNEAYQQSVRLDWERERTVPVNQITDALYIFILMFILALVHGQNIMKMGGIILRNHQVNNKEI